MIWKFIGHLFVLDFQVFFYQKAFFKVLEIKQWPITQWPAQKALSSKVSLKLPMKVIMIFFCNKVFFLTVDTGSVFRTKDANVL